MKPKDLGLLFSLAALWGGSFLFIRVASPVLGPLLLMDLRVLLAGLALLVYATLLRRVPKLRTQWKQYLILGLFNAALPFTLIGVAELYMPASLAAILNATTPLLTALVAAVWIKERITLKKGIGLILGIVGVVVLVGWSPIPMTGKVLLGALSSILAAFFYGVAGVYTKLAFREVSPMAMAIGQQLGAGIVLLPFSVWKFPSVMPSHGVVYSVLALAIACTSVAYLIFFKLVQNIGPTNSLTVTFLVPVFGMLWGGLFLGESIGIGMVIGLVIIIMSIVFVTGFRFGTGKRKPHGEQPVEQ